ncbi:hypothetical protein CANCADRAFT_413 [Tortispora caseinolytica NRRL Y-17796]|uniref:Uncharacterized protein n=1 Tax=Tortispora caseinolytica NRRL Y-17796 TaxID=767744 RepID=A0A1E4TJ95_9ASCO|nr:hypothetical protein CANCADRAFT_413 [Tortispora caseinolytica NRRL Y-17796]
MDPHFGVTETLKSFRYNNQSIVSIDIAAGFTGGILSDDLGVWSYCMKNTFSIRVAYRLNLPDNSRLDSVDGLSIIDHGERKEIKAFNLSVSVEDQSNTVQMAIAQPASKVGYPFPRGILVNPIMHDELLQKGSKDMLFTQPANIDSAYNDLSSPYDRIEIKRLKLMKTSANSQNNGKIRKQRKKPEASLEIPFKVVLVIEALVQDSDKLRAIPVAKSVSRLINATFKRNSELGKAITGASATFRSETYNRARKLVVLKQKSIAATTLRTDNTPEGFTSSDPPSRSQTQSLSLFADPCVSTRDTDRLFTRSAVVSVGSEEISGELSSFWHSCSYEFDSIDSMNAITNICNVHESGFPKTLSRTSDTELLPPSDDFIGGAEARNDVISMPAFFEGEPVEAEDFDQAIILRDSATETNTEPRSSDIDRLYKAVVHSDLGSEADLPIPEEQMTGIQGNVPDSVLIDITRSSNLLFKSHRHLFGRLGIGVCPWPTPGRSNRFIQPTCYFSSEQFDTQNRIHHEEPHRLIASRPRGASHIRQAVELTARTKFSYESNIALKQFFQLFRRTRLSHYIAEYHGYVYPLSKKLPDTNYIASTAFLEPYVYRTVVRGMLNSTSHNLDRTAHLRIHMLYALESLLHKHEFTRAGILLKHIMKKEALFESHPADPYIVHSLLYQLARQHVTETVQVNPRRLVYIWLSANTKDDDFLDNSLLMKHSTTSDLISQFTELACIIYSTARLGYECFGVALRLKPLMKSARSNYTDQILKPIMSDMIDNFKDKSPETYLHRVREVASLLESEFGRSLKSTQAERILNIAENIEKQNKYDFRPRAMGILRPALMYSSVTVQRVLRKLIRLNDTRAVHRFWRFQIGLMKPPSLIKEDQELLDKYAGTMRLVPPSLLGDLIYAFGRKRRYNPEAELIISCLNNIEKLNDRVAAACLTFAGRTENEELANEIQGLLSPPLSRGVLHGLLYAHIMLNDQKGSAQILGELRRRKIPPSSSELNNIIHGLTLPVVLDNVGVDEQRVRLETAVDILKGADLKRAGNAWIQVFGRALVAKLDDIADEAWSFVHKSAELQERKGKAEFTGTVYFTLLGNTAKTQGSEKALELLSSDIKKKGKRFLEPEILILAYYAIADAATREGKEMVIREVFRVMHEDLGRSKFDCAGELDEYLNYMANYEK